MTKPNIPLDSAVQQLELSVEKLRGSVLRLDHLIGTQQKLADLRLEALERQMQDQELRLRTVGESTAQFKLLFGLTSGGSVLASLAALWKSLWS